MDENTCRYCPKCGQAWPVHNDDGSCVDDDRLDDEEASRMSLKERLRAGINSGYGVDNDF